MSIPISDPPDMWSDCSNSDFINWWRKEGHACVKEGKRITEQPITCQLAILSYQVDIADLIEWINLIDLIK